MRIPLLDRLHIQPVSAQNDNSIAASTYRITSKLTVRDLPHSKGTKKQSVAEPMPAATDKKPRRVKKPHHLDEFESGFDDEMEMAGMARRSGLDRKRRPPPSMEPRHALPRHQNHTCTHQDCVNAATKSCLHAVAQAAQSLSSQAGACLQMHRSYAPADWYLFWLIRPVGIPLKLDQPGTVSYNAL